MEMGIWIWWNGDWFPPMGGFFFLGGGEEKPLPRGELHSSGRSPTGVLVKSCRGMCSNKKTEIQ